MSEFKGKHVQKFNSLLSLFLQNLCASLPDAALVHDARDVVNALTALSPGETTFVERFMRALRGCADFLASHNTDVFGRASEASGVITKDDVISIYRQLDEVNREKTWKFVSKLYAEGKKAAPHLVQEGDFDFNSIHPQSPIHGLITTARTLAPAAGGGGGRPGGGLIKLAFRQMTGALLDAVAGDCGGDETIVKLCEDTKALLVAEEGDSDCVSLMKAFEVFYTPAQAQGLVMETEATVRRHGFPFITGAGPLACGVLDAAENPQAIVAACMQVGTVYVTLTTMDRATLVKMEGLAQKFYKKVESGELNFSGATDPMSLMATLAGSGMTEEIFDVVKGL